MKKRGRRKGMILLIYGLCFGWTCFILWYGIKQEKMIESIVEHGNHSIYTKGIEASGLLSWEQSVSKWKLGELLFVGDLFEYCQAKISNKGKDTVSKEIQDLIVSEMNEYKEADDGNGAKQKGEKETVSKPIIEVFDNGSGDITKINHGNDAGNEEQNTKILRRNKMTIAGLKKSYSRSLLLKKFYILDSSTSIDNRIFQVKKLVNMNLKLKKTKEPQILIFHTHGASESFADSKSGKEEDSIIGVGTVLAEQLSEKYGYQVIHDKTPYDKMNGKIDRNKAYNYAYQGVSSLLKKYPSIQVVIDLHRDGVGNRKKKVVTVDGKETAQVMFFNGLSRNASGDIAYLKNNNLQGNLAFSLQLKMACMQHYEEFAKPIYLKSYRYNMHLRKRFTLIELGNENNTVAEEKNATIPLAKVIDEVLSGSAE